jgi:predicted DCC family thiol-disulfide oxidoreductase YuxK
MLYFLRTEAVWRALALAGGACRAAAWCVRIWPPPWRDAVYRLVARMRRRLVRGPGPDPAADANLHERFLP